MKIKHDNNFESLAKFYGFEDLTLFEERLVNCIKSMMCQEELDGTNEEEPWYGGWKVHSLIDIDLPMSDLAKKFAKAVCAEKPQLPDQFLRLVVMGDYDCPDCGGKLKKEDIEEKKDNGYFDPPTYEVVGYDVWCTNCAYYQRYDYRDRD